MLHGIDMSGGGSPAKSGEIAEVRSGSQVVQRQGGAQWRNRWILGSFWAFW